MNKNIIQKIIRHPDKDEILNKLILNINPKDVHEWLASKYKNINEAKFILPENSLKYFQKNYLDVYTMIQQDITSTKIAMVNNTEETIELAVKNNSTYKSKMIELASKEIDVRKMVANLCIAVENRLSQIFDNIQQDPDNINTRIDRLLIEYAETLGNILDKYYKFTEAPTNQVIQNNITLQVVDQHIIILHDVIREILQQMDLESSLYFMEVFNEKMSKLKAPTDKLISLPNTDMRLADAKLLNETINNKLNS